MNARRFVAEVAAMVAENDRRVQHKDTGQAYRSGEFVTLCVCGHESAGADPDDADYAHMLHAEREAVR